MFGYVRPLKGEMKVREFEQFKAAYCGLCHALKKKYGFVARFIINYDFTFLAMLLSNGKEDPQFCQKRCIASPFRRKNCMTNSSVLEMSAARSVVLTYWKLKDAKSDSGFFERIGVGIAMLFLRRAYKKAAAACPEFENEVSQQLGLLSVLEKEKSPSLDKTADCFGAVLKAAAWADDETSKRILDQLMYHIGRWIYIIDALDDFDDDMKTGSYNPIRYRFAIENGGILEQDKEYLKITLEHSAALAAGAMELLPHGGWSPILENIIYLGLPWVTKQVMSGQWKSLDKKIK